MTTQAHSCLAYYQARHYFGQPVADVLKVLFNYDQASLKLLRSEIQNLRLSEVKKALLILVKYQLVDYVRTTKNFNQQFEYSVTPHRIPCFFRLPKYLDMLLRREGMVAHNILKTLSESALLSRDTLCDKTCQSDGSMSREHVGLTLDGLIQCRYIVESKNNLCLNLERLDRERRNDILSESIESYYNGDAHVKLLFKTILRLSERNTSNDAAITSPVSFEDISNELVPEHFKNSNMLEKYLIRLSSEGNNKFFVSNGSHPQKGPMYALNIGLLIDHLVKEHIFSVITTRFGPKCCRVFRVLIQRGPLLLKQIEEIIMLPARDVREYSYMLIKEGFIRNRQIPKTPDNAPGKSVFIMSVEIDQVVYNLADLCCRCMSNLLIRHEFELYHHEVILARSKAVQELLGSDKTTAKSEPVSDDWNQYFNSHESNQLQRVNRTLDKILNARCQVDETLFLFHSWLQLRPSMSHEE